MQVKKPQWNTGDDPDHPLFLENSTQLQKQTLKPRATDVLFEYRGSLCHPSSGVVTQMDLFQAG